MTTDPSLFIEETVDDLEQQVKEMERKMEDLVMAFLYEFHLDQSTLINASANYERANLSDSVFDEAYSTFVGAFLIYLGKKIIDGAILTVADFSGKGINPVGNEAKLVEKMIGFVDGKVVRGGYLHNLGKMSILRDRFHSYLIRSISSSQKLNLFLKNIKPMFISKVETKSEFSKYYQKYAFDSVVQATNSISLYIANKRGLTHFLYKGIIVPKSRPFCVEHVGNVYSRADAKEFNTQNWKGKIPDSEFLITVGGFQCTHIIDWQPLKK